MLKMTINGEDKELQGKIGGCSYAQGVEISLM